MVKRAQILIFLLIMIMMSISVLFNTILQKHYILESKKEQVAGVSQLLDDHLKGTYDDYIHDASLSTEEKIKKLNEELQPTIDEITTSFSDVGAGYYIREFDSIVAFGPNFNEKGLKSIRKESKAREVYETKEPLWFDSVSQTRQSKVIAYINPILRDGEVIGHVWGNVAMDTVDAIFFEQVKKSTGLFALLIIIGLIGVQWIIYYYKKGLDLFTVQLLDVDSNRDEFRKLFPEFNKIVEEFMKNKEKIEESEHRFRDVVNAFDEYVWEINEDFQYTFISQRVTTMLGYEVEQMVGMKIFNFMHPDDRKNVMEIIQRSYKNNQSLSKLEYRLIHRNNEVRSVASNAVLMYDKEGEIIGYRGATRDITTENLAKQKLQKLAYQDPLTSLPNLFWLEERIETKIQHQEPFYLIFIDTDQFKLINDSLGYQCGDQILYFIGKRIKNYVNRAADDADVARFGSDDFVILFNNKKREWLDVFIKDLFQEFKEPFVLGENMSVFITISIGVSCYPEDAANTETLIRYSDLAMASAKQLGTNQYLFYQEKMNVHAINQMDLKNDLHKAIKRNEFLLTYQPQIHLATHTLYGVESLIRWHHPKKGFIRPDQFIPIAEETGLIVQIGKWVLEEACQQGKKWIKRGCEKMNLSVNISIHQLEQADFVEMVAKIIEKTNFPASSLQLEMTESMAMYNFEEIIPKLHELREMGIRISVDDFGKEYSSLSYLKKLPIHQMKIDRSFQVTLNDRKTQSIVKSIIELAHNLQLEVVAEGVEKKEEIERLKQFNCDVVQGYYYAKPLQVDEFEKWLYTFTNNKKREKISE